MGQYTSNPKTPGFCDRCGFRYLLSELRALTINRARTNLLVCPSCWEPDHPQYRVGEVDTRDPQTVRNPRPDLSRGEALEIEE